MRMQSFRGYLESRGCCTSSNDVSEYGLGGNMLSAVRQRRCCRLCQLMISNLSSLLFGESIAALLLDRNFSASLPSSLLIDFIYCGKAVSCSSTFLLSSLLVNDIYCGYSVSCSSSTLLSFCSFIIASVLPAIFSIVASKCYLYIAAVLSAVLQYPCCRLC